LRFFPNLSLDKTSGYWIIFSSPSSTLNAGEAGEVQLSPVSRALLCGASFFSNFATVITTEHNKAARLGAHKADVETDLEHEPQRAQGRLWMCCQVDIKLMRFS
jgi:hypothetical protein